MKLAIVGSRSFSDFERLEAELKRLYAIERISEIVSGGATGADSLAERFAKKHSIKLRVFEPQTRRYGSFNAAAHRRNQQIVNECDELVAFWDGRSPGTKSTLDKARRRGIPVHIIVDKRE